MRAALLVVLVSLLPLVAGAVPWSALPELVAEAGRYERSLLPACRAGACTRIQYLLTIAGEIRGPYAENAQRT